ncbi:UDP-glucuronosyltransferase 2A2-like [Ptychodera flava]|uniref:UDP-glucuronosyltransferase 2A2-like n=1 Tax=Ptychodera flava TaxID=63121 RepID=UPI00396A015F
MATFSGLRPRSIMFAFTILSLLLVNNATCSRILLLPAMSTGSHFMYLAKIGEHLAKAGHEVTILQGHHKDHSFTTDYHGLFNFEIYNTAFDASFYEQINKYNSPRSLRGESSLNDIQIIYDHFLEDCNNLLQNDKLFIRLQNSHFDIAVVDNVTPCTTLIAGKLSLPFVIVSTNKPIPQADANYLQIPTPVSYVPGPMSALTDKMAFTDRLRNLISHIISFCFFNLYVLPPYAELKQNYGIQPEISLQDLMGKAEMALFGVDWAFNFPHPVMPNTMFIGGLLGEEPSPLTAEWADFVNSSEHGIVVFSLGGNVNPGADMVKAEMITAALARLPQRVVMRYEGQIPNNLGNNTKLAKWIPQNDLLGHPKTKAFVTHGGLNGIYQGIFHGVPMVTIPLYGDQHDNAANMVSKGVSVDLKIGSMTSDELYKAIKTVIDESSYKENAIRLSRIHKDRPMSPGESVVFWIEHVIKYGGSHLRAEAFNLNFIQYSLLDVLGFLFLCLVVVVILIGKTLSLACTLCNKRVRGKRKIQ